MKIAFHREFKKQFQKLRPGEKRRFGERRNLFLENEFHPVLQNHPLQGKYEGYRAIHIGGDLSVVYQKLNSETVLFVKIGTHSELYS
jgi:addiction module RelE/StbE family toxin